MYIKTNIYTAHSHGRAARVPSKKLTYFHCVRMRQRSRGRIFLARVISGKCFTYKDRARDFYGIYVQQFPEIILITIEATIS